MLRRRSAVDEVRHGAVQRRVERRLAELLGVVPDCGLRPLAAPGGEHGVRISRGVGWPKKIPVVPGTTVSRYPPAPSANVGLP